ncbi:MAG: DUF169 domain-containing protein [Deltaproteobacteria bacterium]|nr:DUF169 domain-containing protein [Deltaproteobacteria bacterium]
MKKADGIEKYIGCRWTGVSIHSDSLPPGGRIKGKMSLCQAVAESFNKRTVLSIENIDCAGARRSLGLTDNDEILARNISEKTGVSFPAARKALRSVPRFDRPITGLTLGKQPKPDMILCFVPPEKAMALLRRWQEVHGEGPTLELSTFLSLCGGIIAATVQKGQICLSFGCPVSRKEGILPSDTVIIGLPFGFLSIFT